MDNKMTNKEETTPLSAEEVKRVDFTNADQMAKDVWLFLAGERDKKKATISKEALIHEVSVMLECMKVTYEKLLAASQPSPQVEDRIVYVRTPRKEKPTIFGVYSIYVESLGEKMWGTGVYHETEGWVNLSFACFTEWLKPVNLSTLTSIK